MTTFDNKWLALRKSQERLQPVPGWKEGSKTTFKHAHSAMIWQTIDIGLRLINANSIPSLFHQEELLVVLSAKLCFNGLTTQLKMVAAAWKHFLGATKTVSKPPFHNFGCCWTHFDWMVKLLALFCYDQRKVSLSEMCSYHDSETKTWYQMSGYQMLLWILVPEQNQSTLLGLLCT